MTSRSTATMAVASLLFYWCGALAGQSGMRPVSSDPREFVERRFVQSAPAVGEAVPDLPVYDSEGNELRFRDLVQGHYSVVILGCLT